MKVLKVPVHVNRLRLYSEDRDKFDAWAREDKDPPTRLQTTRSLYRSCSSRHNGNTIKSTQSREQEQDKDKDKNKSVQNEAVNKKETKTENPQPDHETWHTAERLVKMRKIPGGKRQFLVQ